MRCDRLRRLDGREETRRGRLTRLDMKQSARDEAIDELVAAARETVAWPFKRRRPFVERLERALKKIDTLTEGADRDDDAHDEHTA